MALRPVGRAGCRSGPRGPPVASGARALKDEPRDGAELERVRLDVWLDVACIFPTRAQAKAACDGGKVDVNGARAKPHRELKPGDRLTVSRSEGVRRQLVVRALASRSLPKAQARALYDDVTPPPSPEMEQARKMDRMMASRGPYGRPDKRERRERIRDKRG